MGDWIGLLFFVLVIAGVLIGLKTLGKSKDKVRTSEEHERGLDEGGSMLTAGVNALNGMLNPEAAKGEKAVSEVKKGTYNKKKEDGKGIGEGDEEE
ncbi:MAG: hypothetical protein R2681_06860 [Pyrinomonadaceae bacterium]